MPLVECLHAWPFEQAQRPSLQPPPIPLGFQPGQKKNHGPRGPKNQVSEEPGYSCTKVNNGPLLFLTKAIKTLLFWLRQCLWWSVCMLGPLSKLNVQASSPHQSLRDSNQDKRKTTDLAVLKTWSVKSPDKELCLKSQFYSLPPLVLLTIIYYLLTMRMLFALHRSLFYLCFSDL